MLLTHTESRPAISTRVLWIVGFAVLTAVAARVTIPVQPVPFTLQTLVVLLSGLVLGWRDGALSQVMYLSAIALGMPIDAAMIGTASLAGPTAGFLFGFVPAAAVAGAVAQMGGNALWMRWLAGIYGVFVLFAFGIAWLALFLRADASVAFNAVAHFIGLDVVKALLAAGLAETARAFINRSHDA